MMKKESPTAPVTSQELAAASKAPEQPPVVPPDAPTEPIVAANLDGDGKVIELSPEEQFEKLELNDFLELLNRKRELEELKDRIELNRKEDDENLQAANSKKEGLWWTKNELVRQMMEKVAQMKGQYSTNTEDPQIQAQLSAADKLEDAAVTLNNLERETA